MEDARPVQEGPRPVDAWVKRLSTSGVRFKCGHWGPKRHRYEIEGRISKIFTVRWWSWGLKELCPDCQLQSWIARSWFCNDCQRYVIGGEKSFYGCPHWVAMLEKAIGVQFPAFLKQKMK